MNKQTGNMYPFVTHTWNPIRGKCPHDCVYCYMKVFPQKELRLVESELNINLGDSKYIFVGSSTDMWAKQVPDFWIDSVLACSRAYPQNTYLFQTKNPSRFLDWQNEFPPFHVLATTIETNRLYPAFMGNTNSPSERKWAMVKLDVPYRKTVTIEPIMDFDLDEFVVMIWDIYPEFVSIGADSKNHHLPEPSGDKIKALITELGKITQVIQKDNLKRLMKS